ncbi:hypothetical protein [Polaribacter sp.]|uniref:hypothetical protein n=1 Tax=Polaribacter sp. TaxID=1920175 RepID=UPI003EF57249
MNNLKLKLKKIDAIKYDVISGAIMALFSFIMLSIVFLFSTIFGLGMGGNEAFGIIGGSFFMVILAPILYFFIGFIAGWLGALLLNFILKKTGGLDIEFEKAGLEVSEIGKE